MSNEVPGAQLPDEVPEVSPGWRSETQLYPHVLDEASPAPSATSELVAGWSFEAFLQALYFWPVENRAGKVSVRLILLWHLPRPLHQ